MDGTLIKESLADERILDLLEIRGAEIWKAENHTADQPKYWTATFFHAESEGFIVELSRSLKDSWYVDLSDRAHKVLVFRNKVIRYLPGDAAGKRRAEEYCRSIGVPESQIDWND